MAHTIFDFPDCLKIFQGVDRKELLRLEVRRYAPKETLITEGTSSKHELYLLLKGVCSGEAKCKTGHNDNLYIKYPKGYFLGLLEIISPNTTKRLITICAQTEVWALVIDGSTLLHWQHQYPDIYNAIISHVLVFQFKIHSLLCHCTFHTPYAACIHYLCTLYETYQRSCYEPDYTGKVKIPDSREEIRRYLAKDIRTINRILNRLKSEEQIFVLKGKIHINRQQYLAMKRVLEEEPLD